MPWLARFTLIFFFLVFGLVEAEAWKESGKEGRWLVRRKRDVAAEQDKDGDDSLHSLLASSSETSPEGEVVPKEKVDEKLVKVFDEMIAVHGTGGQDPRLEGWNVQESGGRGMEESEECDDNENVFTELAMMMTRVQLVF